MVRNTARLMAPIAIAAVAVGVYLIIHANVSSHSAATTQVHHVRHRHDHRRRAGTHHARPRFYTVRAGDTLSAIAARTGVALPTIEQLNPSVSPNALHTGQRLRLRR
jgi:Tfp pilus assembly protein FimV